MSVTTTAGVLSDGPWTAHSPRGLITPASRPAPGLAGTARLIQDVLIAAIPRAWTPMWALRSTPLLQYDTRTPSVPRRSYSVNTSGKMTSSPSASPNRYPSTSNVTGSLPSVYIQVTLVVDSMRSSYRATSFPWSDTTYMLLCGRASGSWWTVGSTVQILSSRERATIWSTSSCRTVQSALVQSDGPTSSGPS